MGNKMNLLYTISTTNESKKEALYIRKQENKLDFFTYFNSFSLSKWQQYTTIEQVQLVLHLQGSWRISWQIADETGLHFLLEESAEKEYRRTIDVNKIKADILGFQLQPLSKSAAFIDGSWYGSFSHWKENNIGISITTYKREKYVTRNIQTLKKYQISAPWLYVQVVDNGSTLREEEQNQFRILHNPNYGGSGGFTRGIIEYIDADQVDYVLLMDDDIVIDITALERTHSLLCGLRESYKDSFLAGAMLRMEQPTIQHENTAFWNYIVSKVLYKGLDLGNKDNLDKNGVLPCHVNSYAGWWYCCIPVHRVKEIGLPIPAFIKSDDIEYGIRNDKELLCMNGIAVWHESFEKKLSPIMRFFSDRNTFILNHYAKKCGWITLFISILARCFKRIIKGQFSRLFVLELALKEYEKGFYKLTAIDAESYFSSILQQIEKSKGLSIIFSLPYEIFKVMLKYESIDKSYVDFKENELRTDYFWKKYLKLGEERK